MRESIIWSCRRKAPFTVFTVFAFVRVGRRVGHSSFLFLKGRVFTALFEKGGVALSLGSRLLFSELRTAIIVWNHLFPFLAV